MIFPKPPLRITKVIGLALILALLHPGSSSADVIITEFMASNNSVIDDEDGESSDWIEIYNTGPALVNLDGFHLTDDPADLTKWRVPNVTIAVEDFVIVLLGICFWRKGREERNWVEFMGEKGGYSPRHETFRKNAAMYKQWASDGK